MNNGFKKIENILPFKWENILYFINIFFIFFYLNFQKYNQIHPLLMLLSINLHIYLYKSLKYNK